jgi:hypothetical protein
MKKQQQKSGKIENLLGATKNVNVQMFFEGSKKKLEKILS